MRQLLLYPILTLLLSAPAITYAGVGFEFEKAFIAPNLEGDILKVAFCDLDQDGTAEAAVATTRQIVVYNYRADTVVRHYDIAASHLIGLVFDDINRDRIPDVVYSFSRPDSGGQFVVVSLDGAGTKADTVTFSQRSTRDAGCAASGGTIGAFDLNKDGFKELLVSADTVRSDAISSTTFGQTRLYFSFPDSLLWRTLTPAVSSATLIPYGVKQPAIWLQSHTCAQWASQPPFTQTGYRYLLPTGKDVEIDFSLKPLCGSLPGSYYAVDMHPEAFRSSGGYSAVTEFISTTTRRYTCGQNRDTSILRTMDMYFLHKPELTEHPWSNEIVKNFSDFVMSPELPDFLFAFEVDYHAITMFRLSDGYFRSRLEQVPTGQLRWWDYPAKDIPRLITVNGQEVAIYHLRATSDSPDDGVNDLLPTTFVLGQPFPNPVTSGLTLPVYIPRPGHLLVEILNRKGKRVQVLADQEVTQGRLDLACDGSKIPSGFYVVRATQGQTSTSKNILLLR